MQKKLPILIFRLLVELIALAALLYVLFLAAKGQITFAIQIGNAPSGAADGGSEYDALVSAKNYYKLGFFANAGLPDRGTSFPLIYTHYPPGPNWLTGLAMKIFGQDQVPLYRSFPIAFSVIGLITSYFLIRAAIGCVLASLTMVTLLQIPITWNMMHGIFHGYALILAIVQISFLFSRLEARNRLTLQDLFVVLLMSFIQGWLSFDWAFISMFHSVGVVSCWSNQDRRVMLLKATLCAILGFGFAHFLHFCQVWALAPSFEHAYHDLRAAAVVRSTGYGGEPIPPNALREIWSTYLFRLLPYRDHAGNLFWKIPLATLSLVVFTRCTLNRWIRHTRFQRLFSSGILAITMSFVVSMAWITVMQNHALQGGHMLFLPRHFICLLCSCLLVAALELKALSEVIRGWTTGIALSVKARCFKPQIDISSRNDATTHAAGASKALKATEASG